MKRGKIHAKNKEKPTFLTLKDDSILRTALAASSITSLKFEHLSNKRIRTTLWLVRGTYCNCIYAESVAGIDNCASLYKHDL